MAATTYELIMSNKNFKQQVQQYMRMGYDQNQATALAQGLPADGPSKPDTPTPPAPIKPAPPPQTLGDENQGSKLKINKKSKRKRAGSGAGTGSLRINLNAAPTGASAGGVNVGGG